MEFKNAMDAILNRRSHRKYTADQLTAEQLDAIMQAYDWAPTARNEQEIRAVVVQDKAWMEAFAADFEAFCGAAGGKMFKNFYYGAPTFVFLIGPREFRFTLVDAGITVENMAIAAESMGLSSVIIGCIKEFMADEASAPWRAKLDMTEDEIFTIGIAIGNPDAEMKPPARKPGKISYI